MTLNLPLLLLNASGEGLKEGLAGLERGARSRSGPFRSGPGRIGRPAFGIQAIVAALGGPGKVVVPASGQEADVEVWGLAHAVEILAARGLVARAAAPEAAARILGRVLYDLGEEHEGMRFLPRLGGCTARAVRGGCSRHARSTPGVSAPATCSRSSRTRGRGRAASRRDPASDRRNRPLLASGVLERVGFGLGLSEGLLSGRAVGRDPGRPSRAGCASAPWSWRPPGAGAPFEVQEELFRPGGAPSEFQNKEAPRTGIQTPGPTV